MSDSSRYGATAQLLHWLTVALVIVLLVTGKVGVEADEPGSLTFYWHSSLGVLVLLLALARIAWALVRPGPAPPATLSKASRLAARATHGVLYLLLIALPLTGWLAASAEGTTVNVFSAVSLPRWPSADAPQRPAEASPRQGVQRRAIAEDDGAGESQGDRSENAMAELHETLGNVLLIVAILHILAALAHRFYWRDGILERMLPGRPGGAHRKT